MPKRKGFYWIWYTCRDAGIPYWQVAEWDGEDWETESGAIFSQPVPVGPFIGDRSGKPSEPPEGWKGEAE
jgi:hypothetical protein